jgi:hypothetical protein
MAPHVGSRNTNSRISSCPAIPRGHTLGPPLYAVDKGVPAPAQNAWIRPRHPPRPGARNLRQIAESARGVAGNLVAVGGVPIAQFGVPGFCCVLREGATQGRSAWYLRWVTSRACMRRSTWATLSGQAPCSAAATPGANSSTIAAIWSSSAAAASPSAVIRLPGVSGARSASCGRRGAGRRAERKPGAALAGQVPQPLAQLIGRGDDHRVSTVRAVLQDWTALSRSIMSSRSACGPVTAHLRRCRAGQQLTRRAHRVDRIAFARAALAQVPAPSISSTCSPALARCRARPSRNAGSLRWPSAAPHPQPRRGPRPALRHTRSDQR